MKKEIKIKEPIRLRTKELLNGCYSLYLDIYINGKRKYEFLKLYIIPERSKVDKERNAETLRLANAIKAEKIVALQNGKYGFNLNKKRLKHITHRLYPVSGTQRLCKKIKENVDEYVDLSSSTI